MASNRIKITSAKNPSLMDALLDQDLFFREQKTQWAHLLHVDLAQKITALSLELALLKSRSPKAKGNAPKKLQDEIQRISILVSEAARSLKAISEEIQPRVLATFGLIPALDSHLTKLGKSRGAKYKFRPPEAELSLAREFSTAAFWICEMALEQIISSATFVDLDVVVREENLVFLFRHNGFENSGNEKIPRGVQWLKLRAAVLRWDGQIKKFPQKNRYHLQISLPLKSMKSKDGLC